MNEPTDNRAKEWRRNYLCRFHITHRWRTRQADDGSGNYQLCLDCGKYRDVPIPGGVA